MKEIKMHTNFWSEKSERKNPLGRPRNGWEDNIKVNIREMGYEGVG